MDSSMDIYVVEMPAILDSLFHKVVNTTSSQVRSHKVAGPSDTKTILWPTGFNSGRFQLYMSQNVHSYLDAQCHQPVL